jgi:hypothetical protein
VEGQGRYAVWATPDAQRSLPGRLRIRTEYNYLGAGMQVFASTGGRSNSSNLLGVGGGSMGMSPLPCTLRNVLCHCETAEIFTIIVQKKSVHSLRHTPHATRQTHHTKSGYLLARRFSYRAESLTSRYSGLDGRFSGNSQTSSFWPFRPVCWAPAVSTQPSICCHEQASKQADRPLEPGLRGKTVSIP